MKTKKQEITENGVDFENQKRKVEKVKTTKKKRKKKISKKMQEKKIIETKDEQIEVIEVKPPITVETELKNETESLPDTTINRQVLMLVAKERGIKNFRVLNKAELIQVLADNVTQEEINRIVAEAVSRWKIGWGRRKSKIEQENTNDI